MPARFARALVTLSTSLSATSMTIFRAAWVQFVGRQLSVLVGVESGQGGCGVGQFAGVNHSVLIGIQGRHHGRDGATLSWVRHGLIGVPSQKAEGGGGEGQDQRGDDGVFHEDELVLVFVVVRR